jgi:hypothetical protein
MGPPMIPAPMTAKLLYVDIDEMVFKMLGWLVGWLVGMVFFVI